MRINNGEIDFDATYEGYPNADGKLLTIQYLGNGKALAYARNDAAGTAIDSYSHYYSIIDLAMKEKISLTVAAVSHSVLSSSTRKPISV